ncbi:MAG TPA: DUF4349 domain-containing protein [Gaiellaceae bacterium]|jgi:hypothetical protein
MSGIEFEGYEALVSELRATAPVAPDRLRQRVLDGAPAPRARRSKKRRLALVVVPVAVVLAVGAAFVHGFVKSGSHGASANTPPLAGISSIVSNGGVVRHQVEKRALAPVNKQKTLPSTYSAAGDNALQAAVPAAAAGSLNALRIPRNRLVHATASLEVRVPGRSELSKATNQATQDVAALGGYAQSVRYSASHDGGGSAVLSLRVPVQRAQTAIGKLGSLGTLLSQQVSTQDLQAKLTSQTSQIGSLKRAIAVYVTALQSSTLPASQRAILQIRLNNARRSLSQLEHARKGTLAAGANADISLVLVTHKTAAAVTHHKEGRLGRLLGDAAHFLALEGIILLYALIVLAPVILLVALGWWILRERRRREERLLAGA